MSIDQTGVNQLMLFNYGALDTATTDYLKQNAQETRGLLKRTSEDIIQVGKNLLEAKARLPHGQFMPWVATELGISQSTSWRFMQAAQGKPVKSFKMNDLLPQIEGPEEDSVQPAFDPERQAHTIKVYSEFFAFLRGERADFDALLKIHENRRAFLESNGREPEDDDVSVLMWEEIEQFAGIRTYDKSTLKMDEAESFDLDIETERIAILSGQFKIAQSGLFGLSVEMGYRLQRVKRFFEDEEKASYRQKIIQEHAPWLVKSALEMGHIVLDVANVLKEDQLAFRWINSKFGWKTDQFTVLLACARRYKPETPFEEIGNADRWNMALIFFDVFWDSMDFSIEGNMAGS